MTEPGGAPWGDPDPKRAWQPGTPEPGDVPYYAPYAAPAWTPPPRVPLRERLVHDGSTFGITVCAAVLLGAPFALLWRAVAPTAAILHTAQGPQPVAPESSQMFATDGWFAVLAALAGLAIGGVAWLWLRRRGPSGPFGLAVGGTLAGLVAAAVGRRMVVDRYLYDFCHQDAKCIVYDGTLHLHALAAVVALPVAMLVAYAALTVAFDKDH